LIDLEYGIFHNQLYAAVIKCAVILEQRLE